MKQRDVNPFSLVFFKNFFGYALIFEHISILISHQSIQINNCYCILYTISITILLCIRVRESAVLLGTVSVL